MRVSCERRWAAMALMLGLVGASLLGCTSTTEDPPPPSCAPEIADGDPVGHADVFGAKASGQARAGRLDDPMSIPAPAHGRQPILAGDYVMANAHIAVVIEGVRSDERPSDGYGRFGGEISVIDRIGDDGRPLGVSRFNETLIGMGIGVVDPEAVTVLQDGSDGEAAIVRVHGRLRNTPFLDGPLGALLPDDFDQEAAYDYVLEPDAEALEVRVVIRNESEEPLDLGGLGGFSKELVAFFQTSQQQKVTAEQGFGGDGESGWVGFVADEMGFAWRPLDGPLISNFATSGFELYEAPGFAVDACSATPLDRTEVIAGGPFYDGLRAAIRRHDGEPEGSAVTGTVLDAGGNPMPEVWVHAVELDGAYVSRVRTDETGAFTMHLVAPVRLQAQRQGYLHEAVEVAPDVGSVSLSFAPHGTLSVSVTDDVAQQPLPARVQVIPVDPLPELPEHFGVQPEALGRLHQAFTVAPLGSVSLPVPPGDHRVIVSRGYDYELVDQVVTVTAGQVTSLDATLVRSVESPGVMCADFHIHTHFSADSSDSLLRKVAGAVADGLEIPCSSEHDWVADFGPVVEELGLSDWAFGMSSSELTTFRWGHFGVVPLRPRPGTLNNGAIEWIDLTPEEVFGSVDALEERPAIVVNHPRGLAISSYFSATSLDNDTGTSDSDLWSDNFDAVEVFNDSDFDDNRDETVLDWFALMRSGRRITAVGNSDSHSMRTSPVGYPRTCFFFGHDDPMQLTDLAVRDGLLSGDSVVSGGLSMQVSGPEGMRPGATLVSGPTTFDIEVRSPSWIEADSLEVIVSGVTVDEVMLVDEGTGPGRLYRATIDVELDPGDAVVFHARGKGDLAPLHPGRRPFAVSNPFYTAGALRAADFAARRSSSRRSTRARAPRPSAHHHHH